MSKKEFHLTKEGDSLEVKVHATVPQLCNMIDMAMNQPDIRKAIITAVSKRSVTDKDFNRQLSSMLINAKEFNNEQGWEKS